MQKPKNSLVEVDYSKLETAVVAAGLKPCKSPYCECSEGKCSAKRFYDARGEAAKELTKASTKELVTADGENSAVRNFLILYSGQTGISLEQMQKHLRMSGYPYWPEWVNNYPGKAHLTKGGAQNWLRHLFNLEKTEKISSDGSTLVDSKFYYKKIDKANPPPKGVKMLLSNETRGTATLSNYTDNCDFTHYAGLPKFQ